MKNVFVFCLCSYKHFVYSVAHIVNIGHLKNEGFCVCLKDYFDIVKNPMDLSTIKRKLDTGQYQEPWQYVDDVWLMFNNAWLYNRKTSRVYKFCTKLAEVFEQEIDPVMQSLGYCCGRKVCIPGMELHSSKELSLLNWIKH